MMCVDYIGGKRPPLDVILAVYYVILYYMILYWSSVFNVYVVSNNDTDRAVMTEVRLM